MFNTQLGERPKPNVICELPVPSNIALWEDFAAQAVAIASKSDFWASGRGLVYPAQSVGLLISHLVDT